MRSVRPRKADDYNDSLSAPVRVGHRIWRVLDPVVGQVLRWCWDPARRFWATPMLLALVGCVLVGPFDGALMRLSALAPSGGDIRRELEVLGQYGGGTSIIVAVVLIWLLDPKRRRHLLDWVAAGAFAAAVAYPMKMLIGRPRPRHAEFYHPWDILGPVGQHPFDEGIGLRYAWEFWSPRAAELWAMPSSHAVFAAVMSVFLATLYPRLRGAAVLMVILVALSRVLFEAHYMTDVIVGSAIGYACATAAIRGRWGQRAAAALFGRDCDTGKVPAGSSVSESRVAPTRIKV